MPGANADQTSQSVSVISCFCHWCPTSSFPKMTLYILRHRERKIQCVQKGSSKPPPPLVMMWVFSQVSRVLPGSISNVKKIWGSFLSFLWLCCRCRDQRGTRRPVWISNSCCLRERNNQHSKVFVLFTSTTELGLSHPKNSNFTLQRNSINSPGMGSGQNLLKFNFSVSTWPNTLQNQTNKTKMDHQQQWKAQRKKMRAFQIVER